MVRYISHYFRNLAGFIEELQNTTLKYTDLLISFDRTSQISKVPLKNQNVTSIHTDFIVHILSQQQKILRPEEWRRYGVTACAYCG
jgi:hypothetical protein